MSETGGCFVRAQGGWVLGGNTLIMETARSWDIVLLTGIRVSLVQDKYDAQIKWSCDAKGIPFGIDGRQHRC